VSATQPAAPGVRLEDVLAAVRRHLAEHHVCTLATAREDAPWAASCFYAPRDLDLYICQRRDARTLANLRANPRVGFAVDDRRTEAWLQGAGGAAPVSGDAETWARDALSQAAPEFVRHFSNLEFPVLRIRAQEITFVDRRQRIRSHLILREGGWGLADES
jgi:uncharacterized protein YhbP (UPF0306 family)